MRELSIEGIGVVNGAVRMAEAAVGMVAIGGALALGPFVIAAGVAFGAAAMLETMDLEGWSANGSFNARHLRFRPQISPVKMNEFSKNISAFCCLFFCTAVFVTGARMEKDARLKKTGASRATPSVGGQQW